LGFVHDAHAAVAEFAEDLEVAQALVIRCTHPLNLRQCSWPSSVRLSEFATGKNEAPNQDFGFGGFGFFGIQFGQLGSFIRAKKHRLKREAYMAVRRNFAAFSMCSRARSWFPSDRCVKPTSSSLLHLSHSNLLLCF